MRSFSKLYGVLLGFSTESSSPCAEKPKSKILRYGCLLSSCTLYKVSRAPESGPHLRRLCLGQRHKEGLKADFRPKPLQGSFPALPTALQVRNRCAATSCISWLTCWVDSGSQGTHCWSDPPLFAAVSHL